MYFNIMCFIMLSKIPLAFCQAQAPALEGAGSPIRESDRMYTGDQSSNTVTVIKPYTMEVLGTISLGDVRLTDVIGPQYMQSVNAHGLGFSRDGKYIVSMSVTSNTVTVIRTLDNSIVSQTFTDRQSHEAFFAADNRTVWVGTRGVDHIDIVDGINGGIIDTVLSYGGPSKILFSPDGRTAYANHIRSPSLSVIDVEQRRVIDNITGLADTFSSDMMISADGTILWAAHKMVGKCSVIDLVTRKVIDIVDTGPETNHPNFAILHGRNHVFVTVAGLNLTRVYQQPNSSTPPTYLRDILSSGIEPHGLWPSPDNTHMYVVNEHSDTVDAVDLKTFEVVKTVHVGQEGQALIYVSGAVPEGNGTQNLGSQGLTIRPPQNRIISVDQKAKSTNGINPTALVTVRELSGLDMLQIIGRNLRVNATYVVYASCEQCNGIMAPMLEFEAVLEPSGCGGNPQVLAFLKVNDVYSLDSIQIEET